mmetsp:Transcript_9647/g.36223  ORF Transcript_9647/g.36223 Transcript_9647/m.36223 type:complete len:343 (+) Transcript_9647:1580-2608(+)
MRHRLVHRVGDAFKLPLIERGVVGRHQQDAAHGFRPQRRRGGQRLALGKAGDRLPSSLVHLLRRARVAHHNRRRASQQSVRFASLLRCLLLGDPLLHELLHLLQAWNLAIRGPVSSQGLGHAGGDGGVEENVQIHRGSVSPVRRVAAAAHARGATIPQADVLAVGDHEGEGGVRSMHLVVPAIAAQRLLAAKPRVVVHQTHDICRGIARVLAEVQDVVQAPHVLVVSERLHARRGQQHEPAVHRPTAVLSLYFQLDAVGEGGPEVRDEVLDGDRRRAPNLHALRLRILRPDPVRPLLNLEVNLLQKLGVEALGHLFGGHFVQLPVVRDHVTLRRRARAHLEA